MIKIRKTIVFEDLGEVVSITTDLIEIGGFGFSDINSDEYCFSEKHVLKTEEGIYYTRTFYRSDAGKEWWGDFRLINLDDYPEPSCAVRVCFNCRAAVICKSGLEKEIGMEI